MHKGAYASTAVSLQQARPTDLDEGSKIAGLSDLAHHTESRHFLAFKACPGRTYNVHIRPCVGAIIVR